MDGAGGVCFELVAVQRERRIREFNIAFEANGRQVCLREAHGKFFPGEESRSRSIFFVLERLGGHSNRFAVFAFDGNGFEREFFAFATEQADGFFAADIHLGCRVVELHVARDQKAVFFRNQLDGVTLDAAPAVGNFDIAPAGNFFDALQRIAGRRRVISAVRSSVHFVRILRDDDVESVAVGGDIALREFDAGVVPTAESEDGFPVRQRDIEALSGNFYGLGGLFVAGGFRIVKFDADAVGHGDGIDVAFLVAFPEPADAFDVKALGEVFHFDKFLAFRTAFAREENGGGAGDDDFVAAVGEGFNLESAYVPLTVPDGIDIVGAVCLVEFCGVSGNGPLECVLFVVAGECQTGDGINFDLAAGKVFCGGGEEKCGEGEAENAGTCGGRHGRAGVRRWR